MCTCPSPPWSTGLLYQGTLPFKQRFTLANLTHARARLKTVEEPRRVFSCRKPPNGNLGGRCKATGTSTCHNLLSSPASRKLGLGEQAAERLARRADREPFGTKRKPQETEHGGQPSS